MIILESINYLSVFIVILCFPNKLASPLPNVYQYDSPLLSTDYPGVSILTFLFR